MKKIIFQLKFYGEEEGTGNITREARNTTQVPHGSTYLPSTRNTTQIPDYC